MEGSGFESLEEWLENMSSFGRSSSSTATTTAVTARDIAQSWSTLRDCLQRQGGVVGVGHLLALQKLHHSRLSLHVAEPQAKLLISLLSSAHVAASDPPTLGRACALAMLILAIWVRKSSRRSQSHEVFLLQSAVDVACKLTSDNQSLFVSERILLLGCLSAAPLVSPDSRRLCQEVVVELVGKEKEVIIVMSQGRLAEALAGAGYALFSCDHASLFQSILDSLLSLWTAHDGLYACLPHGLMLLHLMEWTGLNLIKLQTANRGMMMGFSVVDKMNVFCVELPKMARLGVTALSFTAVMAAGGLLRASYNKLPEDFAFLEQLKSSMEETIVTVAGNVVLNFGPMAERPGNFMLGADSVQFAEWVFGKEGTAGLAPATRPILQCVAVAVSRCQGISFHANILLCLVVSLLIESFPLQDIYSSKIMSFPDISALGEMEELGKHISSILFKEAGAMTRAMCNQYCSASRELKQLVQHLMWEFSQALYGKHRIFRIRLNSSQQTEDRKRKYHEAMEKITEIAFFMLVMFLSIATKNDFFASSSDFQEQLSVITLDALSCVEYFRHMQLQEYSDMVKRTVSCVSKSASACASLVRRLPSYDDLTQWSGSSKLRCSEYCWYKDEVQTARVFFYLRILPTCLARIPDEVFGMELAPLMFLYMQHPDQNIARGSHAVFVTFMSVKNLSMDSSHNKKDDTISLKEQLVVYYIQRALEAYPRLTPFEGLSSGVQALVKYLPAGSPAIVFCINSLVQKSHSLYNANSTSNIGQDAEVEGESESAKNLQGLLLHLIFLVDIQVLPDLLKLLAQLIIGLPEGVRNMLLGEAYDLVAGSDDAVRKPILVPWLQSLSLICSQLSSGTSKSKETRERSSIIKDKDVQLKTDNDKSGGLSLNPTCQNCLVQLSRI